MITPHNDHDKLDKFPVISICRELTNVMCDFDPEDLLLTPKRATSFKRSVFELAKNCIVFSI